MKRARGVEYIISIHFLFHFAYVGLANDKIGKNYFKNTFEMNYVSHHIVCLVGLFRS